MEAIREIAERIKGLREMSDIPLAEMAAVHNLSEKEYAKYEEGEKDFSFTFLYKCAEKLGVDVVDIMTGESPRLTSYTVVRKDRGLTVKRRVNFKYQHLASLFKGKLSEPFVVTAPFNEEEQNRPISLNTHNSQEFDYVLSGTLKVQVGEHVEELHEGDSIYYDATRPHGMIASGGAPCTFIAVVIK